MLNNAGTVVSFRLGVEDAPLLAPLFAPRLTALDLAESPNLQGYMRLHLDHAAVRPFSFAIQKPARPSRPGPAEKLVRASRERWGLAPEECNRRAEERRKFIRELD